MSETMSKCLKQHRDVQWSNSHIVVIPYLLSYYRQTMDINIENNFETKIHVQWIINIEKLNMDFSFKRIQSSMQTLWPKTHVSKSQRTKKHDKYLFQSL